MTFSDHIDFPYSGWSDVSTWPELESLAALGFLIVGISIKKLVEPGDQKTRERFEAFKKKFVQQNCHRDEQIRCKPMSAQSPDINYKY